MDKKRNRENPLYDDAKFYDIETVASVNDCTGSVPTPPKSENEAESYSDMLNIPRSKGKVNNSLQHVRPKDDNKK